MKKLFSLLMALCLCLCLTAAFTHTAYAGDLDYIHRYDVTVTPNAEDGSLHIRVDFQWEVLEQGPVEWLEIGIPNGSIRETEVLTDNIASLDFDNSFMYVTFDRGYDDGEIINFSYAWTQEYMYTLDEDGSVSYVYSPGYFNEARIGEMTVTWNSPADAVLQFIEFDNGGNTWTERVDGSSHIYTGTDLGHGARIRLIPHYSNWPTELFREGSSENLPDEYFDYYGNNDYYDDGDDLFAFLFFLIFVVIVILVISAAASSSGYAGGFGTHYVHVHGLWYPAGRDGRPRPGSVGTKHKPQPPRSSGGSSRGGGGFGGGSRGGGFGGGGFGGGSHCACASSCACACACACAGGGRAGCSAKNLYGAVRLDRELSEHLTEE